MDWYSRCVLSWELSNTMDAARLRHIAGTQWGLKRYMNMDRLKELKREQLAVLEGAAG